MLNTASIVKMQEKLNRRIDSQVADTAHALAHVINELDVLKNRRPLTVAYIIRVSWPELLTTIPARVADLMFWLLDVEPFERPPLRANARKGFA